RPAKKAGPPYLGRRRSWLASLLVPLAMLAGGGTVSAWLYAMQQNVVMAGIVGLSTLVASLFASVLLRG
ncbi:MAG: hypothetical protein ABIP94_23520, partial [Planctomycetota bacterium]